MRWAGRLGLGVLGVSFPWDIEASHPRIVPVNNIDTTGQRGEARDVPGKVEPLGTTDHLVNLTGGSFRPSYSSDDGR